ncbi:MAG: class I SAM-dependent methyltransferase [Rhodopila sp.]
MSGLPDEQDNSAQIAYWNDRAAVTWTAFQERLDVLFEPLTALALDAAGPAKGEHAIDVGCGCGATVLALADRVGPSGQVLGLDVSNPMAARARERIAASGLTNVQIMVSDAATHDFAGAGVDLLFSRFGVMFFADPVAAFANLHRAVRPGGRLLCAAWRPRTPLVPSRSLTRTGRVVFSPVPAGTMWRSPGTTCRCSSPQGGSSNRQPTSRPVWARRHASWLTKAPRCGHAPGRRSRRRRESSTARPAST